MIDNYCKIVKCMKYYGRYMDDIYIIHEDKEYLKGLLNDIQGTGTYQQGLCHKDAEKAEEVPEAHGCRGDVL